MDNLPESAATSSCNDNVPKASLEQGPQNMPICIIVLGMAGSGKTTFVRKLSQLSHERYNPYLINLDPACREVPYNANIDIRDTVNYKEVMKQYKLGPNGSIVTSLNLFTTKIEKVVDLVSRAGEKGHKWCIIDTPGQIEVFTWSASGSIITEAFATSFPTIVVYVMDVVRSVHPTTFMSNMLYACSILYKSSLPFVIALNKIDLQNPDFINEWMTDFEAFQEALQQEQHFVTNLTRNMSLTLDTFYENLKTCGVSSVSGIGFSRFFDMIAEAAQEYENDYKVEFNKLREAKLAEKNNLASNAAEISTEGTAVPLLPHQDFIEEAPVGSELADTYLRFPGTELNDSDDEANDINTTQDESEEQNFQAFVNQHKVAQQEKLLKSVNK